MQLRADGCLILLRCLFCDVLGKVKLATLPRNVRKHLAKPVAQTFVSIGCDQQQAMKASFFEAHQEVFPGVFRFIDIGIKAKDFTDSLLVNTVGNHKCFGDNPSVFAYLEVGGIHCYKGKALLQGTAAKSLHLCIQLFTDFGDGRF